MFMTYPHTDFKKRCGAVEVRRCGGVEVWCCGVELWRGARRGAWLQMWSSISGMFCAVLSVWGAEKVSKQQESSVGCVPARLSSTNHRADPHHVVLLFTTRLQSYRRGCWENREWITCTCACTVWIVFYQSIKLLYRKQNNLIKWICGEDFALN